MNYTLVVIVLDELGVVVLTRHIKTEYFYNSSSCSFALAKSTLFLFLFYVFGIYTCAIYLVYTFIKSV